MSCQWTGGNCLLCLPTPCGACSSEKLTEPQIKAIRDAHEQHGKKPQK